ncbi:hypothetical protein C0J29_18815 [Mycobacterium paragordonae]|jgi:hypothetical protein|uniref:Ig-like domain-containing protein n=2 Tax=Mycobacterium paragordonae TaxID=1389713 RepID=A0ABQ1C6G4_9MYCO|nr:DUF6636 domain-containing protein [Mycobacterium gordonae]AYE96540.1 hypothetical protein C0J29_18815 [Mycobacterium paragordonae]OBK59866.1 hypothetical protein A5656_13800 [Mycobacterium gordonae]GFG80010.1 hypothetical protein MPRG_32860 [Mycobacterium paragordonae]
MRILMLAPIAAVAVLALPATAHADGQDFQTPSGNIACSLSSTGVACDINEHTYTPPPPPECGQHLAWGDRFVLEPGKPATIHCHGDTVRVPGERTLNYGQTASAGTLSCISEQSGVKCTDSSSGHYFEVSRDAFKLG